MGKKYILIIFLVASFGLSLAIYQYVKEFGAEIANAAYTTIKPSNGHSWSEMECTSDFCIKSGGVGIGAEGSSSNKLNVVGNSNFTGNISASGTVTSGAISATGNVTASGDVCNGSGACLSQIASFVGSQLLVNGAHTYADCTSAGGAVVNSDVSLKQCQFTNNAGATCPSGWTQYKSYCKQAAVYCAGVGGDNGGCDGTSCSLPAGTWGNAYSSCQYTTGGHMAGGVCGMTWGACAGTRIQIGCY